MRSIHLAPFALAFALVPAHAGGQASAPEVPEVPGAIDVSRVEAGIYEADPAHTLVGWRVSHFGFNDYLGTFGGAEGTLSIDPANPSAASLDISLPLTSVAVPSERLRDHLLRPGEEGGEPDFFGVAPAPARFVSTRVAPDADGLGARIEGNLTLMGVTRPVAIEARFTGAGINPMNRAATIGFHGTTVISRSAFGIDYAVPPVGDKVALEISAAFERR